MTAGQARDLDLARVAAIVSDPPALRLRDDVVAPPDAPWQRDGAQQLLDQIARIVKETAATAVAIAWRFAWSDEGIAAFMPPYREPQFADGELHMPALAEGPLMRVEYFLGYEWPFPVEGTGTHWEERTGHQPYREDYSFRFYNRYEESAEELDAGFSSTWSDGGASRIHAGPLSHPGFTGGSFGLDYQWRLERGAGTQTTSLTHAEHIKYGPGFSITGRAPGDELSGGLSLYYQALTVNGVEQHESHLDWTFARNARAAEGEDDWPAVGPPGPSTEPPPDETEIATAPDDDESGEPEPSPPDEESEAEDESATGGEATDAESDDDGNGTDDDEGNPSVPPPPDNGEDGGGTFAPPAAVTPGMEHAGVLTGPVDNNSIRYDPGHVVVYLEGEALPEGDGRPLLMDLSGGFRQAFVAVPIGGAIRFRNVEPVGGASYTLLNEDLGLGFEHYLAPGDEVVVLFPDEGRFSVVNARDAAQRLEVAVVPSTRFAAFDAPLYVIRDIPPATYIMHVETESRRYQPVTMEVTVAPTGHTTVGIELVERGGGLAGLSAP